MAREIFQNPNLTHLHLETLLIFKYISENKIKKDNPDDVVIENEEYFPPRNIIQCVARVNRYICQELHHDKLSPNLKKGLHALIAYMSTHRFLHQIKTFTDIDDRILFESEFIRCTYDKEDLTAEEVDQYIVYATEVIIGGSILRRVQKLEEEQDRQIEDGDGRINMALVDAVKSLRDEYNKCAKRQQDLIHSLKIKRSERLSTAIKETASILNLVNMWKEEDSRKQLIELAIRETQGLKDEINRLGTMDELKARILGLSDDEILYG
jgi:hypothetical protein